ncbi:GNAT family N-acetyltransferase [Limnohabitans sp. 103DPR2]|uniref:GNAT family N-acetyltransferase n=1 Tax=Limnohabitans sp. 103DPR2 TaxID=1678129 RepID=UPI0006DD1D27|nr:GNAT family N-acetyltransferase [Limnohabitans sp. 103DPR2]ALK91335.1 hypothetical protein L103DPR2_00931 [Limnohabitans sp. 103DPR2]
MFNYDVEVSVVSDVTSDVFPPLIKIREITNIKEKRKWMEYFTKGYSGSTIGLYPAMFSEICRYFVAEVDGKDAGFIRITNYTETWKNYYDGQVWNASDAYVKQPYRSKLVLRKLLEFVIANCNVVMARLETERLYNKQYYYRTLGFTYAWTVGEDEQISIAVIEKLKEAAIRKNIDYRNRK